MPPKYKAFLVLIVIILLFILNIKASLILAIAALSCLLFSEPKLIKFFTNPGFLIFAVAALGVPLLINFSISEFEQNFIIVFRGILITFWIYLYTKNFTSSSTYKTIKRFLPDELIRLINISSGAITIIQEKTLKEFRGIKTKKKSLFEHIVTFFYSLVKLSETISFASGLTSKKIIIITGKIHEGKTTFAAKIAEAASKTQLKAGGILSRAEIKNGERIAYYAEDIKTKQSIKLITKEPVSDYYDRFWHYYFLKDGMKFVQKSLSPEYLQNTDMAIIDEIGAMELENRGYDKQVLTLLKSNIPVILLVIREQFIESILKKYNITPLQTVRVGENPEAVIRIIQNNL